MILTFSYEPYGASVRDFGAAGNGLTDDSGPIQKALDSPHPVVTVPEGTYLLAKTLRIGSGKILLAHPRAILRLGDGAGRDAGDFILTNANHDSGNDHIVVSGGIWDGNNENNTRGPDGPTDVYTGVALAFVKVNHLRLSDLTVRNPDSFSIRIGETNHFSVENITFDHQVIRRTQDGVHVGGFCEDGIIRNLRALHPLTTNDDMVALNADDDVTRAVNLGMKLGPIRNVHVEGLRAESPDAFVRILSQTQPVENIRIRDILGGSRIHAIKMDSWRFPHGSGHIRNVDIRDIRVTKAPDSVYPDLPGQDPDTSAQWARTRSGSSERALLPINLNVGNLVVERWDRPEDGETAPTLVIENGLDNHVQLALRSLEQMERLDADSTLSEGTVQPLQIPDRDVLHQADLRMSRDDKLVLPTGGFERFELNPEA